MIVLQFSYDRKYIFKKLKKKKEKLSVLLSLGFVS